MLWPTGVREREGRARLRAGRASAPRRRVSGSGGESWEVRGCFRLTVSPDVPIQWKIEWLLDFSNRLSRLSELEHIGLSERNKHRSRKESKVGVLPAPAEAINHVYIYIYIHIYTHSYYSYTHMCVYIYIYIYIYRLYTSLSLSIYIYI